MIYNIASSTITPLRTASDYCVGGSLANSITTLANKARKSAK